MKARLGSHDTKGDRKLFADPSTEQLLSKLRANEDPVDFKFSNNYYMTAQKPAKKTLSVSNSKPSLKKSPISKSLPRKIKPSTHRKHDEDAIPTEADEGFKKKIRLPSSHDQPNNIMKLQS